MIRKSLLIQAISAFCLITGLSAQETKKDITVLITGANRGLGLEFAKQYSKDGYTVIGTARTPEEATELKATGAEIIKLDVNSDEDIAAMAKTLKDRKLDILINNAGYFGPKLMDEKGTSTFETITRKEMEDCIRVNTLGPLFVSQALIPNLKLSKDPKIVHISTGASIIGGGARNNWGYTVSKTALNRVMKNMHASLHKDGIIVIALDPGHNKTDMGTSRAKLEPKDTIGQMIPLIANLDDTKAGRFWCYDGRELPW